ncbi:MAG: TraR/DksA C4-type zinc finger protein [Deltaproteobacteria bacterium]|nr:TraR/DksA C4-type zinc finger protein [Deltaproteobacteria bacterium]
MDLSAEQHEVLKRALLKKGGELADKLSRLLAGERVADLGALLGGGTPGERPEEKLRRFLARIDAALAALRAGSYGGCEGCGVALGWARLEQLPWADRCASCAAALG